MSYHPIHSAFDGSDVSDELVTEHNENTLKHAECEDKLEFTMELETEVENILQLENLKLENNCKEMVELEEKQKEGHNSSSRRRKEDECVRMTEPGEPCNLDQSDNTCYASKQFDWAYMKQRCDRLRDIEVKYNELNPKYTKLEIEFEHMKKEMNVLQTKNIDLKGLFRAEVLKNIEPKKQESENSTDTSTRNDYNLELCRRCEELETKYNELHRKYTNLIEEDTIECNKHINKNTDIMPKARTNYETKCQEMDELTSKYDKLATEHHEIIIKHDECEEMLKLTKQSLTDLENILQKEKVNFGKKYKELENKHQIYFATKMTRILQEQNLKFQNKCKENDELENKHIKEISVLAKKSKEKMASMESSFSEQRTILEDECKELSNQNSDLRRHNEKISAEMKNTGKVYNHDNVEFENICKTKDEVGLEHHGLKSQIIDLRKENTDKIKHLENRLTVEGTEYEEKCNELKEMSNETACQKPDLRKRNEVVDGVTPNEDIGETNVKQGKDWNELEAKCHNLESENSELRKTNNEKYLRFENRLTGEGNQLAEKCKELNAQIMQHQGLLEAAHSKLSKQYDEEVAKYNFAETKFKIAENKYVKCIEENEQLRNEINALLIKVQDPVEKERDESRNRVNVLNTGGGHCSHSKEVELGKRLEEQNEQHKKMVMIFQTEIKSLREKNRELQGEYKKQKSEKDILSLCLAEEWSDKLSSDECNIENVSIKNRPMMLVDEMQQLLNTEWLVAKCDIDSQCASSSEMEKQRFLCEILMTAEKHAKEYLTVIIEGIFTQMFHALWDPFNLPNAYLGLCDKSNQPSQDSGVTGGDAYNEMDYGQKDQQTENAGTSNKSDEEASYLKGQKEHNKSAQTSTGKNTIHPQTDKEMKQFQSIVIRDQLKNGIRDFLRVRADDISTASLVKKIEDEFLGYAVMVRIKGNTNFTSYLVASIKLAWKMVIQSPAMEFDVKGLGEKYNPNRHEPSYDSENPNDESSKIQYYVHPTLLHANKVMVKGKVHIKKTE